MFMSAPSSSSDRAGTARGTVATGRHLAMPNTTNLANLWLTTLRLAGGNDAKFADSTGTVPL